MSKRKGIISEFKEFISRGSVVDLAVGVVIGGAFTAIVTSLVNDVIMPAIGWVFGGASVTDWKYVITPATDDVAETAIRYGNFIQSIINFLLIAIVIFLIIKAINRFQRKKEEAAAPAKPAEDIVLLTEIRDLLSKKVQ